MESLGERLKTARERKGCTFDQISRDTNIARRYLEALENEDFGQFPGEPYLLGFLRNYGDYLGMDTQELISAYRMLKIQEQPVPVEQLLKDTRPNSAFILLGALAAVGFIAVGIGAFFVFGRGGDRPQAVVERKATEYELASGFMEKRLYQGDSVLVSVGAERFKLVLSELGSSVKLQSPGGDVVLDLGQEGSVDLNGDGFAELKLFVADLFKNDPSKGAALRLELADAVLPETAMAAVAPEEAPAGAAVSAEAAPPAPTTPAAGTPVIFSSPNPYPFTLQATFKGYCMFRWEADRKEREERYFHKAELLNVQAQNGIRLWVSNAGAVKLQAIGGGKTVDLDIGGSGEVVVTDLKWVKDADGRFKLTTVRLD